MFHAWMPPNWPSLPYTHLHSQEVCCRYPESEGGEDKSSEEICEVDWENSLFLCDNEDGPEEHRLGGVVGDGERSGEAGEEDVLQVLHHHEPTGAEGGEDDRVEPGLRILSQSCLHGAPD